MDEIIYSKDSFKRSKIIDASKPLWVIGPSAEVSKHKDFIINNLHDKNTMCIGHGFHRLVTEWDFTPTFFTWYDPHQTVALSRDFDLIKNKLKHRTMAVIPDFNKNVNVFPASCAFGLSKKHWTDYEDFLKKTTKDLDMLLEIIYISSVHLSWLHPKKKPKKRCSGPPSYKSVITPPYIDQATEEMFLAKVPRKKRKELAIKLFSSDGHFRFNEFEHTVFGTDHKCTLENFLTHIVLPVVHFLGFTKVFILGFDGGKKRFYSKTQLINQGHKKFCGMERWVEWKKDHGMQIYNLQKTSPLAKKIPTIDIEFSLSLYHNQFWLEL